MYLLCVPFVEVMPLIHNKGWTFGETVCRVTIAVDNAYQEWVLISWTQKSKTCLTIWKKLTSVYFMAAMALDRCMVIAGSKLRTRKFTIVICSTVWIVLFLLASPIYSYAAVSENGTRKKMCNFNFAIFTDIQELLRQENYVPYGDQDENGEFFCTVSRQFHVHSGAREQFSPPNHSRQSAI